MSSSPSRCSIAAIWPAIASCFRGCMKSLFPRLVARDCHALIQNLGEITRSRHHKFGNTVFHLEPNVKDGPGGLRDYNVACWLALISAMEKLKMWPDASHTAAGFFAARFRCGARFPNVGALLSALPLRPPRQHAELGRAGRSRRPQDRRTRCRNHQRRRLDAHLLRPRARRAPRLHPIAGRDSRRLVVAVSSISGLANESRERRFFRRRRPDFSPAARARCRIPKNCSAFFTSWPSMASS